MKIAAIRAAEIIFEHLKGKAISAQVTGGLYLYQRPAGSRNEDIVVNSIGLTAGPVQQGVMNVNIFVPNLKIKDATGLDHSIPNTQRLSELASLGGDALRETWGPNGTWMFVEQQSSIMVDRNDEHFVNFRVVFRAENHSVLTN